MKKRNSSVELLKLFAIFLIALNHAMPFYGDVNKISFFQFGLASFNIQDILLNILKCSGNIGNIIFIVCSCFYLCDSKITNKQKILYIILDCLIISLIGLLLFLLLGVNITKTDIIKQFFPMTFNNNWFIVCYLLLYAIHPLLNIIINNISKVTFFRLIIVMIIMYSGVQFLKGNVYFFNELLGFVYIYFVVSFIKKNMVSFRKNLKLNFLLLILAAIGNIILILVTNFLGLNFAIFSDKVLRWDNLVSPFYLIIGITLFNICNNFHFYNKKINYFSSLSLLFYLIHENFLFRKYVKPLFYEIVFPNGNMLLWIFVEMVVLVFGGFLLAMVYKETLQKVIYKIGASFYGRLKKIYLKIEDNLLEI